MLNKYILLLTSVTEVFHILDAHNLCENRFGVVITFFTFGNVLTNTYAQ